MLFLILGFSKRGGEVVVRVNRFEGPEIEDPCSKLRESIIKQITNKHKLESWLAAEEGNPNRCLYYFLCL